MKSKLIFFLLILGLFFTSLDSVFACDFCAVFNQVEIEEGSAKSFKLGLAHQFTHQSSNIIRPEGLESFPGQYLDSNITQVISSYRFTDRFGVQLNLPLIYRKYRRVLDDNIDKGSEKGVGDLVILGTLSPIRMHKEKSTLVWDLFAGAKLATGNSDPLKQERELFLESLTRHGGDNQSLVGGDDIALGSGSTDGIFGTSLFYQLYNFFLSGQVQYAVRTKG
ncbi:MAG: hypothetical protein KDD56_09910, partial [Bdellovibrionales bacterium]|nr:hypothetical protein [Bdellovibrionales bacterium]